MNVISGRHAFILVMPLAAAALIAVGSARLTAAAEASPALAAQSAQAEREKGERLLNASCGGCHDLRPVQASAKDREGWNEVVQNMLQRGADVSDADMPLLLELQAFLRHLQGGPPPMTSASEGLLIVERTAEIERAARAAADG